MKWFGWLLVVALMAARTASAGVDAVADAAQGEYPAGATTAPLAAGTEWPKTFNLFADGQTYPINCTMFNIGAVPHDYAHGTNLTCQLNLVDLLGSSSNNSYWQVEPIVIPDGVSFPSTIPVPGAVTRVIIAAPGNHDFFHAQTSGPIYYIDPAAFEGVSTCDTLHCNDRTFGINVCRLATEIPDTNPDVLAVASVSCHN